MFSLIRRHFTRCPRAPHSPRRLWVECLEDRCVPATTFIVTNTAESGPGSLRQAILDANANPGADAIHLAIGSGFQSIAPFSALPTITEAVELDATTQPGYAGTPIIELNGSGAGAGVSGLTITGAGSTVRGLVVNRFGGAGVVITGAGATGNAVSGNYIGTDAAGTAELGNSSGVRIDGGASNNTIGGTSDAARNLISGNTFNGIDMSGTGTTGNTVAGNYIGTNAAGTAALGNGSLPGRTEDDGVYIYGGASGNTIGGTTAGARNVISGNAYAGIAVIGVGTDRNVIRGNYIGTNAQGTAAIDNSSLSVAMDIYAAADTVIGGDDAADGSVDGLNGARNVIVANQSNHAMFAGGINTVIAGNYVGIDATGTVRLQSVGNGIGVGFATNITIGGTTAGAGNVIASGNVGSGILISPTVGVNGATIQGNIIGLDRFGDKTLGGYTGVSMGTHMTKNILIGGTTEAARNIISGHTNSGIRVGGTVEVGPVVIQGNYVGTDATGTKARANGYAGIYVDTVNVTVGGTTAGSGNLTSGNSTGIIINGDNGFTEGNTILGNYIGTDRTGTLALGNFSAGIRLEDGAVNTTTGGTAVGAGNLIRGNGGNGITVIDGNTVWNSIRGNAIFGNGGLGIDLGNNGVTANDSGDADSGPNGLQNYPVLTQTFGGATTTVQGTFNSTANTCFTLDFYASPAADAEGGRYLGSLTVTTDGAGNATFSATLGATSVGEVVTATATDDALRNTSEFSTASVPIFNRPPTAVAGGPYTVAEGSSITLNGSGSSDPDQAAGTLTYEWDFDNDGFFDDAVGMNPIFSAVGLDGFTGASVTVRLRVTDAGGLTDISTATVSLTSVAPTANITGPATGQQGIDLTFQATGVTDPSPADTAAGFTFSWQVTRGSTPIDLTGVPTTGSTLSFFPTESGTYTITLIVTDKDGGAATVTHSVVVGAASGITQVGGRLIIVGTSGDDDIAVKVAPGSGPPEIKVIFNGIQTTYVGVTEIILYANAGDDRVQIAGGITLPVIAFGGAGDDRLKAGGGPSILVGGDGADSLLGGSGRDVLIGGNGADVIGGNGADDILVAGSTAFDGNLAALSLIRAEWTSARSFADRVANLSGAAATGVNGRAVLRAAGPDQSVFDDNAVDRLTGDAGNDWFVFNSVGGVYVDQVTDLSEFEGLFDTDL